MKNIGFSSESVNVAVEMKKKAAEAKQKPKPGKGFPKLIRGTPVPIVNGATKHRQNDPCPCGSGKKFKKCHGRQSMEGKQ